MTLNQKCAVLVTLESRMESIKSQLERETDDYTRGCLVETLGELVGGYMCIELIQPTDLYDETDPCRDSDYSDRDDPCESSDYGEACLSGNCESCGGCDLDSERGEVFVDGDEEG